MARRKGRSEGGGDSKTPPSEQPAPAPTATANPPGRLRTCGICGEWTVHDESVHEPEEEYEADEEQEHEPSEHDDEESEYLSGGEDEEEWYGSAEEEDGAEDHAEASIDLDPYEGDDAEDEDAAIAAIESADEPTEGGVWKTVKPKRDRTQTAKPPKGDYRPTIKVSAELYDNVMASIHALSKRAEKLGIYQQGFRLVHVVRISQAKAAASPVVSRSQDDTPRHRYVEGTPEILGLDVSYLRPLLTHVAWYERFDARSEEWKQVIPSDAIVRGVHAFPEPPGIPHIVGVAESPFMRPDGTICQEPGFDETTGYLFAPTINFTPIPEKPTQRQAKAAFKRVAELFVDFPFANEAHRSVPIAGALTAIARPGIPGAVPAHAVDGNVRGAGKSLITDVVATLVTGRAMPRTTYPPDEDELRKVLDSFALEGTALLSIDNISREFGGGCLDAYLTARDTVKVRILGSTKHVTARWVGLIFATGNNIQLYGDTADRLLMARLESADENPRRRPPSVFRYPQLLEYVRSNRGRLVADLLIILRAFIVAGSPAMHTENWGSFEEWSALIPPAIVHAGGADPMGARILDESSVNQELAHIAAVVAQWSTIGEALGRDARCAWNELKASIEAQNKKRGPLHQRPVPAQPTTPAWMTCKEIIDALYSLDGAAIAPGFDALREAIDALCCPGRRSGDIKPTSIALSAKLRAYKGRPFNGKRIASKRNTDTDVTWWWVEPVLAAVPPPSTPELPKLGPTPPRGKLQLVAPKSVAAPKK